MRRRFLVVCAVPLVACGSFHGRVSDLSADVASWRLDAAILRGIGERAEGQPVNKQACETHLADIKSAAAECKAETLRVEQALELCQPSTKTQLSNCPRCESMLALEKAFSEAKCRLD